MILSYLLSVSVVPSIGATTSDGLKDTLIKYIATEYCKETLSVFYCKRIFDIVVIFCRQAIFIKCEDIATVLHKLHFEQLVNYYTKLLFTPF